MHPAQEEAANPLRRAGAMERRDHQVGDPNQQSDQQAKPQYLAIRLQPATFLTRAIFPFIDCPTPIIDGH